MRIERSDWEYLRIQPFTSMHGARHNALHNLLTLGPWYRLLLLSDRHRASHDYRCPLDSSRTAVSDCLVIQTLCIIVHQKHQLSYVPTSAPS